MQYIVLKNLKKSSGKEQNVIIKFAITGILLFLD